jgi:peptide/nickel transport system permease protein
MRSLIRESKLMANADAPSQPQPATARSDSIGRLVWRRFRRHKMAMVSCVVLLLLVLFSTIGPYFTGHSYSKTDRLRIYEKPSKENLLGRDDLGRDVLTRLMYGGRVSLAVGLIGAVLSAAVGVVVGGTAGYWGRWVDGALMRFVDFMLSVPSLPIMIILASVDLKKVGLGVLEDSAYRDFVSIIRIIIIAVIFGWMGVSRLVRAEVLSVKERTYVFAARALGFSNFRILSRHILPNAVSPIFVSATLAVGSIILMESALSFLGLGIQPPYPSWGSMLNTAQNYIRNAPMLAVYPGVMILLTVMAFNFIGDGLRDAFDPRQTMR